jgi:hypothetical protein
MSQNGSGTWIYLELASNSGRKGQCAKEEKQQRHQDGSNRPKRIRLLGHVGT